MRYTKLFLIFCIAITLTSCKTVSDEAKYEMDKPVNCRTAEGDIAILEKEKASTGKKALAGIKAVSPAGIATGLLSKDWKNRKNVATGEYNKALDAKINEIKVACNID